MQTIDSPQDEEELIVEDEKSSLRNIINEQLELENFESQDIQQSQGILANMSLTFSPNFVLSLLFFAFVIERNGVVSSSIIFLHALMTHYFVWDKKMNLLHSKYITEFTNSYKNLLQVYNIFLLIYYLFYQVSLILVFKDILTPFFNLMKDQKAIFGIEQSIISNFLFVFLNLVFKILSKPTQSSILRFSLILSCLLLLYLVIKVFYFNCKNQYGSNRSLQVDNFSINLLTSFCFVHFALGTLPQSSKCKPNSNKPCILFSSFLFKTIISIICGYVMYFSYGRYINTTLLFSFHNNDISANFCRIFYIIAIISTNSTLVNHFIAFVNDFFENSSFETFYQNHEIITFSLFILFAVCISFFIEASLPLIEICGAISFWIFDVIFICLFSISVNENEGGFCKNSIQIVIVALSIFMFACTIFCCLRDICMYYHY